jgi:anti-sigma B factor antagonist
MLRNLRKLLGVDRNEGDVGALEPNRPVAGVGTSHSGLLTHAVLGQTLVITVIPPDLNAFMASEINHELRTLLEATPSARNLVLDLENINYLDSAGLNAFVDLLAVVRERQGRIAIAAATQQVEVLFKLTRLELVFSIRRTVIEAVDAIERTG